jgi:transposase-like protein
MSQSNNVRVVACLRCPATALRKLSESTQEVMFFECPSCLRHYACKSGEALTYRWLHPVGLALYGVLFEPRPLEHAQRIAASLLRNRPSEKIATLIEEIELELEHPTQQVRDILENVASEAQCREFLAAVVHKLRTGLHQ